MHKVCILCLSNLTGLSISVVDEFVSLGTFQMGLFICSLSDLLVYILIFLRLVRRFFVYLVQTLSTKLVGPNNGPLLAF